VPRVEPRREQLVRAEAFAHRGLLSILTPHRLSPERLRVQMAAALASPREELRCRIRSVVDFNGADIAAEHLLTLARTAHVRTPRHSQQLAVA